MKDIIVNRYKNPKEIGWAGCIEPSDKSWIAFIDLAGRPLFFLHRDPTTGAVIDEETEERP
jgi:hypothetical protein